MRKIGIVIGTRPEAIKLFPVYLEMIKENKFEIEIISTGQHKEMVQQVYDLFEIKPHRELSVMKKNQSLNGLLSRIIESFDELFSTVIYDAIIVQGDTSSCLAAAITAFHRNIKVFHIEAGLRSFDLQNPFPEEANRKVVSVYSSLHFTPTERASQALLSEKYPPEKIKQVGNTVIDSLSFINHKIEMNNESYQKKLNDLDLEKPFVLITCHRRESFGSGIRNICEALGVLAKKHENINFIFPVHLNPEVNKLVYELLSSVKNIILMKPVPYDLMIYIMKRCMFILTDSGGIQEEAPSFGKPVLVMRETTERMEGIEAGSAKLIGNDKLNIVSEVSKLINDDKLLIKISPKRNPYGDGNASKRIHKEIYKYFEE